MCVCGKMPCTVKHKKLFMLACPDAMRCCIRGGWASNEQAAIKSWNIEVQSAKHERRAKT